MSIGNEPGVTRRSTAGGRSAARRGVPSWADPRPAPDAHAAQAVAVGLRFLEPQGWTTLSDVPHTGPGADHVAVGPGGVVAVHVLADAGPARDAPGTADDVLVGGTEAAATCAATVTALLAPRHRSAVHAVVCTPGRRPAEPGPNGVVVVGGDALVAHLRELPGRLAPADVGGLADHLATHLDGPCRLDLLTTAAVPTTQRRRRRTSVAPSPDRPRRRAVRPLTGPAPEPQADAPAPDVLSLALRVGAVLSSVWLAWVFVSTAFSLA